MKKNLLHKQYMLLKYTLKLQHQQGVALLMVMGLIAMLTAVLADFTFQVQVNKLQTYNQQDRAQARLNAEAGLNLAIARLKIYQETLNVLEKNESIKKMVDLELLNQIYQLPIHLPIELPGKADVLQRTALEEFTKNLILQGELTLDIQNTSQLIDLNLLRVPQKDTSASSNDANGPDDSDQSDDSAESGDSGSSAPATSNDPLAGVATIQEKLIELLTRKLEEKRESMDNFEEIYGDPEPRLLIKSIKYFVNDKNAFQDEDMPELESLYQNVHAKHTPMSSLSELHLVPGLTDAIIDLFKDQVTVHSHNSIDINKITKDGLKMLMPEIEEEHVKKFFEYRDNPEHPVYFNSLEDFKRYVVQEQMVEEQALDERIQKLKSAGIEFGPTGSFFRATSSGSFRRGRFTLEAYVSIPVKIIEIKKYRLPPQESMCRDLQYYEFKDGYCTPKKDSNGKTIIPPREYLTPRVVELLQK